MFAIENAGTTSIVDPLPPTSTLFLPSFSQVFIPPPPRPPLLPSTILDVNKSEEMVIGRRSRDKAVERRKAGGDGAGKRRRVREKKSGRTIGRRGNVGDGSCGLIGAKLRVRLGRMFKKDAEEIVRRELDSVDKGALRVVDEEDLPQMCMRSSQMSEGLEMLLQATDHLCSQELERERELKRGRSAENGKDENDESENERRNNKCSEQVEHEL